MSDEILPTGTIIIKHSKKPFKSGRKLDQISGYRDHPVTRKPCYLLEESDTHVECFRCREATKEEIGINNDIFEKERTYKL